MAEAAGKQTGIKLGLVSLVLVMAGFLVTFLLGPDVQAPPGANPSGDTSPTLLEIFPDRSTRLAVEALRGVAPATYATLDGAARRAQADGASAQELSRLTLEALFSQFSEQAFSLRTANGARYQLIIAGLADGLTTLKASQSRWCDGASVAEFLSQDDSDLVPALLAEFPYGSAQYEWAMQWMTTVLTAAKTGQDLPRSHARPGLRDEAILQQEGLALGSEQWGLALQIATFANAEGTSYGQMREAISSVDVCDLGIAVEQVSGRLPDDVRTRIWADLLPEIMLGNTPYVMWRVTDYFFIG